MLNTGKRRPTEQEIQDAARLLFILLPMEPRHRIDVLATVCRLLWDDRLDEMRAEVGI